ncbi:MAG: GNAT family N-acetyltransferase [Gemmatimonadaceae bacterium]
MSTSVTIEVAQSMDESALRSIQRLVPMLSPTAKVPSAEEMQRIIQQNCARVLLARRGDGEIVGALTLVVFRIPTGMRAWIEDVVVDEGARGAGIGEALTREALRLAANDGAECVDLTSRPAREAANRLYQRLGFSARDTNVYRYSVGPAAAAESSEPSR